MCTENLQSAVVLLIHAAVRTTVFVRIHYSTNHLHIITHFTSIFLHEFCSPFISLWMFGWLGNEGFFFFIKNFQSFEFFEVFELALGFSTGTAEAAAQTKENAKEYETHKSSSSKQSVKSFHKALFPSPVSTGSF
jgi:hypothetical protein